MRHLIIGLACCNALWLSGCVGLQLPPTASQEWVQHRTQLEQLKQWTANGKIALRTAEQAESGTMQWRQQGDTTHIRLAGPMGISTTTLDSDGETLEIRQGDDYSRWRLDDPALQANETWQLPLRALHYWLKGIPAPQLAVESVTLDELGQLPTQIRQQGWTVDYQSFQQFDTHILPTRLRLYRGDTSARIIVRQWEALPAP